MEYDNKLIEAAVLVLLTTFRFDNGNTWKGFDFETMNRLHEQDFLSNVVNKSKRLRHHYQINFNSSHQYQIYPPTLSAQVFY